MYPKISLVNQFILAFNTSSLIIELDWLMIRFYDLTIQFDLVLQVIQNSGHSIHFDFNIFDSIIKLDRSTIQFKIFSILRSDKKT